MRFFRLNPITRRRLKRFRQIKRGYYSLLILLLATFLSLFSEYLANNKPIVLSYNGDLYFPTWTHYAGETFGQEDPDGYIGVPADYRALAREWQDSENWILMPPIPFHPTENDFSYDKPPPNAPDSRHLLGTDSQGRDVLARLIYGFRISIFFSLALVIVSQIIGVIIGSLQGYLGGWFDLLSQRGIEIWSTMPFLYVVVLLATFFTPNFWLLLAIMALFQWMGITYYMRTEMYREKAREYCMAVRSLGASHGRVVFQHLLPNCLTPLVTFTPFAIVGGILALTALDFLGYGLPPPTPSWGEMIDQATQSANRGKLWLSLAPFTAITVTLVLVTLVGEAVREAFDPKPYAKYR